MESRWIWPFELLDKLGEGGMGVVYRARYVGNNRQVAVKLLPPDIAANETLLARFERELEVLKRLRHPNIVHCFGGTCESDERFYAMELIDGGTLADVIQQKGCLSWDVAIDYAIQMCDALQYAHERGIIHRDIKPSNFLMTKLGQLKLSDFGLVTVAAGRRLTASGRTLGTVEYMSPEQIRGKPPLTNRSDLYALGCVIHEMLIGQPPYLGDSPAEVMHKHLKEPIPHIARKVLDCPKELDQLVCELLAKTPEQRPDSASEVGRWLEDILQPGRHVRAGEPTLFSSRTPVASIVAPLKGNQKSESLAELPKTKSATSNLRPPWSWLVTTCLAIVCLTIWSGWSASSSRLRQAEQVLVDQLDKSDLPTRLFAVNTLAKFGPLHPTTIAKLYTATMDGHDEIKLAALAALARHPAECRAVQLEIYKLQQNAELNSAVRHQAGLTFNEIKQARAGSTTGLTLFWSLLFSFLTAAAAGGWWVWHRVRPLAESDGGRTDVR